MAESGSHQAREKPSEKVAPAASSCSSSSAILGKGRSKEAAAKPTAASKCPGSASPTKKEKDAEKKVTLKTVGHATRLVLMTQSGHASRLVLMTQSRMALPFIRRSSTHCLPAERAKERPIAKLNSNHCRDPLTDSQAPQMYWD